MDDEFIPSGIHSRQGLELEKKWNSGT
jgi:hypothetical protein